MQKHKLPTTERLLGKKRLFSKKKDLEWNYLEEEMLKNIDKKPYNEAVHDWLVYLKDLRLYKHLESKRQERQLQREVGPPWYVELSCRQIQVLDNLKANIHQDVLEDMPRRIRVALDDLGITAKIPKKILMKTMIDSGEDPGVFMWYLYNAVYNEPPSTLRASYDMDAIIMMSSLVFIDMEECVDTLRKLTAHDKQPEVKKEAEKPKYYEPKTKYGAYLQKMNIPLVTSIKEKEEKEPIPLGNKFRLRSKKSYEDVLKQDSFLKKRIKRNIHEKAKERICEYKFWEPPASLRNQDPKMVALIEKQAMMKKKARVKFVTPYKNTTFHIGNVCFTGQKPNFLLGNACILPTGFIIINGGISIVKGTAVTIVCGNWKYPNDRRIKCDETCDCMQRWESSITTYLEDSKCKCCHKYDFKNEGKLMEKYFHSPSKNAPFWMDYAKVYQMDPKEDFILDAFEAALKSNEATPAGSTPSVLASGLKESELLQVLLADLGDTPLVIPHLPKANLLNNLNEWIRKRLKSSLVPQQHTQMLLTSQRRWLNLKHVDFRARAFTIPFTEKQMHNFNWSHRRQVQDLFDKLMKNFVTRNRLKQIEQTRLWWPTMKFDCYRTTANKPFLDVFFTYLPSRMKDTHFINPYSSLLVKKTAGKTCSLKR